MSQISDYVPTQVDRPLHIGLTLPTTCKPGQIFFLVSTTASANKIYASFALNTWTQIFDANGQNNTNKAAVTALAVAASVTATNILINGAIPVAGLYRVQVYCNVKTQPTVGTIKITMGWNDGTARTLDLFAAADINSSTGVTTAQGEATILADGTHNVTYAITYASLTGVPSTDVYITLTKVN